MLPFFEKPLAGFRNDRVGSGFEVVAYARKVSVCHYVSPLKTDSLEIKRLT
jgi:hypothetical protein